MEQSRAADLAQHKIAPPQTSTDDRTGESSLSQAEVRALIEFFELLDRWDREVVQ